MNSNNTEFIARIHVYCSEKLLLIKRLHKHILPEVVIDISKIDSYGKTLPQILKAAVKNQTGVEVKVLTLTTLSKRTRNRVVLDFLGE